MDAYALYARVACCLDFGDAIELASEITRPGGLSSNVPLILGVDLIKSFKAELTAVTSNDEAKLSDTFQQFKTDAEAQLNRDLVPRALVWGECFYILKRDPRAVDSCIALAEKHKLVTLAASLRENHKLPDVGDAIVAPTRLKVATREERIQLLNIYALAMITTTPRRFIRDLLESEIDNEAIRGVTAGVGDRVDDEDNETLMTDLIDRLEDEFSDELKQRAVAWVAWHKWAKKGDRAKADQAVSNIPDFAEAVKAETVVGFYDFARNVVGNLSLEHPSHVAHGKSYYYVTKLVKEMDPVTGKSRAVRVQVKEERQPFVWDEFQASGDKQEEYVRHKMLQPQVLFELCRSGKFKQFNRMAGNRIVRKAFEKTFDDVMGRTYKTDQSIFPVDRQKAIDEDALVEWLKPHAVQVSVELSTVHELVAELNELRYRTGERFEDEVKGEKVRLHAVDDEVELVDSSAEEQDDDDVRMSEKGRGDMSSPRSSDDETPLVQKLKTAKEKKERIDDELAAEFASKKRIRRAQIAIERRRREREWLRRKGMEDEEGSPREEVKEEELDDEDEDDDDEEEEEEEEEEELTDKEEDEEEKKKREEEEQKKDEEEIQYGKRKKMALDDDDDPEMTTRGILRQLGDVEEEVLEWQFTYQDVVAVLEYISKFTVSRRVLDAVSDHLLALDVLAGTHSGGVALMELFEAGPSEERKCILALVENLRRKYTGKSAGCLQPLFRMASKSVIAASPLSALHTGHVIEFIRHYNLMSNKPRNLAAAVFSDSVLPAVSNEKAWLTLCRELQQQKNGTNDLWYTGGFPFDVITKVDLAVGVHALVKFDWNDVSASKEWTPVLKFTLYSFVNKMWTYRWFNSTEDTSSSAKKAGDDARFGALKQIAAMLGDERAQYESANMEIRADQKINRTLLRDTMGEISERMSCIERLKNEYAKISEKLYAGTFDVEQEAHTLENIASLNKNLGNLFRNNRHVKSRDDFKRIETDMKNLKREWTDIDQRLVAATRRGKPMEQQQLRAESREARRVFEKRSAEWLEVRRAEMLIQALERSEYFLKNITQDKLFATKKKKNNRKFNHDAAAERMKELELKIEKQVRELETTYLYVEKKTADDGPESYTSNAWLRPMVRKLQLERRVFAPLQEFICTHAMMSYQNPTKQASTLRRLFAETRIPCVSLEVAKNIWRYDPAPFNCDIHFTNFPNPTDVGKWISTFSDASQMDRLLANSKDNGFEFLLGPNLLYSALRVGCQTTVFVALISHERMKNARRAFLTGKEYRTHYHKYLNRATYHLFDYLIKMPMNSLTLASIDGKTVSEADYYLFSPEEIADHCLRMDYITELEILEMNKRCSSSDPINDTLTAGRTHPELAFVNAKKPSDKWSYPKLILYSMFNIDEDQRRVALQIAQTDKRNSIGARRINTVGRLGASVAADIAHEFPDWEPEPVQSLRNHANYSNRHRVAGFTV